MTNQKPILIIVVMAFAVIAVSVLQQRIGRKVPVKNTGQFTQPPSREFLVAKGDSPLGYASRRQRSLVFVPLEARKTYCSLHKITLVKDNVPVVYKSLNEKPEYVKWGYINLDERMFPNTWREIALEGPPPSVSTGHFSSFAHVSAEVHFCPQCRAAEDNFYSDIKSAKWHCVTNSDDYALLD